MIVAAVAAVASVGVSAYSSVAQSEAASESRSAQDKAQNQAKADADKQAKLSDEANNYANRRQANPNAILSAAQQAAKTGGGSTMLTGAQGVAASDMTLGKTNLLGA